MTRAIRYRYLARSRPGSRPQLVSNAFRADATALSTSASPAWATLARGSSEAGLSVVKCSPLAGGTNCPSTNRLYSRWMVTISRDSGAGAYSQSVPDVVVLTLATVRWPPLCFLPPSRALRLVAPEARHATRGRRVLGAGTPQRRCGVRPG